MMRWIARPFGYLAFVLGVAALSLAAALLGERHELGFFSGRLANTVWRYPEVTRRGMQTAWIVWAVLFGIAISPLDPISSPWDEAALAALAALALLHRFAGERRAGR
jgi:hypothetical protein